MSILLTIQNQLKDAMRAKDAVKLETLRYVLSELKYSQIAKQHELSDEEATDVLSKEVKKRKDAVELFRNSGRLELVEQEEAKLIHITALLPEQLSEEVVAAIVDEVIAAEGKSNMGAVMKGVMARVKGKADGRMISTLVQTKLKA